MAEYYSMLEFCGVAGEIFEFDLGVVVTINNQMN